MLESAIVQAAAEQVPDGVVPDHEIEPEYPSAHAQGGPPCMLEFAIVQATTEQVPDGVVPDHEIEPEYPSAHAHESPARMLEFAIVQAATEQFVWRRGRGKVFRMACGRECGREEEPARRRVGGTEKGRENLRLRTSR